MSGWGLLVQREWLGAWGASTGSARTVWCGLSTNGWVWAQHERLGCWGQRDPSTGSGRAAGAWGASTGSARTVGCGLSASGRGRGVPFECPQDRLRQAQGERSGRGVLRQAQHERLGCGHSTSGWDVGVSGILRQAQGERGACGCRIAVWDFGSTFCDALMARITRVIRMIWSGGLLSITRGISQAIHIRGGRYGFSFVRSFLPGWRHFRLRGRLRVGPRLRRRLWVRGIGRGFAGWLGLGSRVCEPRSVFHELLGAWGALRVPSGQASTGSARTVGVWGVSASGWDVGVSGTLRQAQGERRARGVLRQAQHERFGCGLSATLRQAQGERTRERGASTGTFAGGAPL